MTNTTDTYWDVDGVSLQTLAFNIVTLGGDRLAPPPLRGGNVQVPYSPGQRWVPKQVDQRSISLGMWVIGAREDGSVPTTQLARRQFDDNWQKLRKLLWTPLREIVLTKRFYVSGVLKTAQAKAQFRSGLEPMMSGPARAQFTVDLALADPYFYSTEVSTPLSTGSQVVSVEGDDRTRKIKIHVVGPRTNVKIRNDTLGIDVEYHDALLTGDTLDIDVAAFTSSTDPDATAPFNSEGSIRATGDAFWLLLAPGDNTIIVSSDSGSGAVTLTHQAAWL